jgi:hypothetical protein
LFGFLFGAIGLGIAIWGWSVLSNARASLSWPTTEGRVVFSEVDHSTDSEGGDSYSADIVYRYEVDDQEYENDRVRFGENSSSNRGPAEDLVERYPVGRNVDVHYEPDDPDNSVLEPGVTLGSYLGLCLGGFFVVLAIILVPVMVLPPFLRNR